MNVRPEFSSLILCLACVLDGFSQEVPADNQLTKQEQEQGWLLLFDGKTFAGWFNSDKKPSQRPVENGTINPHRCGAYMMTHKTLWEDFILKLDFKQSPKCNSGVFFRVHTLEKQGGRNVGYNGLEVAIDDTTTAGFLDTGAIYDLSPPIRNNLRPIGAWNRMVLTCSGTRVIVALNGEGVNAIDLADFRVAGQRPDGTSHKFDSAFKDHPRVGHIGLQDHGADIWFKNIKILPLKD